MLKWRDMQVEKPDDGQMCLCEMKHGFISGCYDENENNFSGYYWRDMIWYARKWVPIEEVR